MNDNNLLNLVPEVPSSPTNEISREIIINSLLDSFSNENQKQILLANSFMGKTNLCVQIAKLRPDHVISYFITSNPFTQNAHTFFYVLCNQMAVILEQNPINEGTSLEHLKAIYLGFSQSLSKLAISTREKFFIVIDGLDNLISIDGNLLLDDFQLLAYNLSPYILYTAKPEVQNNLPWRFKELVSIKDYNSALYFDIHHTKEILKDINLSKDSLNLILQKSKGIPGYVKVYRDNIKDVAPSDLKLDEIPDDVEKLINKQINNIRNSYPDHIYQALTCIATCPKSLNISYLEEFLFKKSSEIINELTNTGLVELSQNKQYLFISHNLIKEVVLRDASHEKEEILRRLLKIAENQPEEKKDHLLLTLLYKGLDEYDALRSQLTLPNVIKQYDTSKSANLIIKRSKLALDMARDKGEIEDTLMIATTIAIGKSLLDQTIDSEEILALIAIGEYKKAFELIYSLPYAIEKISLLGKTYSEMKEQGKAIPESGFDELRTLVDQIHLEQLEKETVQSLAIDIFRAFPDLSIHILNKYSQDDSNSLIEAAMTANIVSSNRRDTVEKIHELSNPDLSYFARTNSSWTENLPVEKLIIEINELDETGAKEFMIRQWCLRNKNNKELTVGIILWLDTVIADHDFVITLKSLRRISSVLKYCEQELLISLVSRLEVPEINALKSPWEEWIGFKLNLIEAIFLFDRNEACNRLDEINHAINFDILDLDIKIFCYARLWLTIKKHLDYDEFNVKANFERILAELLSDSALHDEILERALLILASEDIEYALYIANKMNTYDRRIHSTYNIFIHGFNKQPDYDFSTIFDSVFSDLELNEKTFLLQKIVNKLSMSKTLVTDSNQELLLANLRKIPSNMRKAKSILELALIWTEKKNIKDVSLAKEAINFWKEISNIKDKISIGFKMVRNISKIDRELGNTFFNNIQEVVQQPGATLAHGNLSNNYVKLLELLIQSISKQDIISEKNIIANELVDLIKKIPSNTEKIRLFGQLAARSYSYGYTPLAEKIIDRSIIPLIDSLTDEISRIYISSFILPVLYRFNKDVALKISKDLPYRVKENTWYFTLVWVLTNNLLVENIDIENLNISSNYNLISTEAFNIMENIDSDHYTYLSTILISKTVERSLLIDRTIDLTQAFDLLQALENIVISKLPDSKSLSDFHKNITHDGYLLVSLARINGARANIYINHKKKWKFSKDAIRKTWDDLYKKATKIQNTSDKVFVLSRISDDMHQYNPDFAEIILKEADELINSIPSILDRSNRLTHITTSYANWGLKTEATYLIEKANEMAKDLGEFNRTKQLEVLVQTAYQFDKDLAENITHKFDSRDPDKVFNPLQIQLEIQKFIDSPQTIIDFDGNHLHEIQKIILRSSAKKLYAKSIINSDTIPNTTTILNWIYKSCDFDFDLFYMIQKWTLENIRHHEGYNSISSILLDRAKLIGQLASMHSINQVSNFLPEDVAIHMSALKESTYKIFKSGEEEIATSWLKKWIRKNCEEYIKIVDPYFGIPQFEFFENINPETKILVITTSNKISIKEGQDKIATQIIEFWNKHLVGKIPQIMLVIVPKELEGQFHKRVLISSKHGLDIDPSLNSIGNKYCSVKILSLEEVKELDALYVKAMLDTNTWFMDHNIQAHTIFVGNKP